MKRTTLAVYALLALLSWSSLASAASQEKLIAYVGGQYEFMNPDSERNADQFQGGRLFFGYPIVDYASLELSGRYLQGDLKSFPGLDDKQIGLGLDLVLSPWRGPLVPYMLLGGGGVRDEVDSNDETNGYVNAGIGFWTRLWQGLFLRTEVRRTAVFGGTTATGDQTTLNDTHVGVGLQYMWIKEIAEPTPPPRIVPPPPPPDPCASDSDGDGVPDCRDVCPDTPRGFKVDARGCIEEKQTVVVLSRVLFDLNSSTLRPEAAAELDKIVQGLKSQPTVRVEIGGHTCNIGTEPYNLGLSRRRAEAVQSYLVSHGIDASRLTAEGYGEFSPIVSNDTESGRQQNRRVEFRILSK
jgi:OOP family OmpA-OmpF porin